MKLGQIKQYREKLAKSSPAELDEELVKLRKEQFVLRVQRATGQTPKPDQFGSARRNIARVKTVLREKAAGAPAHQAAGGDKK
jgi:large subunit ribosomal protein L29